MAAGKRQIRESTAPDRQVRDRTLSDKVYESILAKIMDGDIPVGGKLPTEQMLSDEFGVSRPILRQALKQL
ncbi:MAG: GntR family transcriptional regulator, partial [Pseudomonadota bacterium]